MRWVAGAEDGVRRLAKEGHTLWILSYCGRAREVETRAALRSSIPISTLIPEARWIFVRSRDAKLPAMRTNKLDVLIDDTWQIVRTIRNANTAGLGTAEKRAIYFASRECPGWEQVRV